MTCHLSLRVENRFLVFHMGRVGCGVASKVIYGKCFCTGCGGLPCISAWRLVSGNHGHCHHLLRVVDVLESSHDRTAVCALGPRDVQGTEW